MIRVLSALLLSVALSACGDARNHAQAVYVLVDTSGTFAQEATKAQVGRASCRERVLDHV